MLVQQASPYQVHEVHVIETVLILDEYTTTRSYTMYTPTLVMEQLRLATHSTPKLAYCKLYNAINVCL